MLILQSITFSNHCCRYALHLFSNSKMIRAEEDVRQASSVSNQLDHLWTKRANEMRNNLVMLAAEHDFLFVDITNLRVGSMELNTVRPFFVEAASQLYTLTALAATVSNGERLPSSQSEGYSSSQRPRGEDGAPLSKHFRSDAPSQPI
jgi:hypothetical protein